MVGGGWTKIGIDDAKKICKKKDLIPARIGSTELITFSKKDNKRMKEIDWDDFESILKGRKLQIYESYGFMKIMKK